MRIFKVYKILVVFFIIQWAFIKLILLKPQFVEQYYSTNFYLYISNLNRIVFGKLPFSFGDLIYIALAIYLINLFYTLIRTKKYKLFFWKLAATISIVYFLFNISWAFNYYRVPLKSKLNIEKTEYTLDELLNTTDNIIKRINTIHVDITKNDSLKVDIPYATNEIYSMSFEKYKNSEFKHQSVKNSLFSIPLTYMGFTGYLNPFTGEAHVNSLNPKINYPSTTCHEIAHQVGYASEAEANFIGFLNCIDHSDKYFNYSGYYMALQYCLADIYRKDEASFLKIKESINHGIILNMIEQKEFWNSYKNPFEKYFKAFYDAYLKANKQKDGIKGYSKMVGLLVNYPLKEYQPIN